MVFAAYFTQSWSKFHYYYLNNSIFFFLNPQQEWVGFFKMVTSYVTGMMNERRFLNQQRAEQETCHYLFLHWLVASWHKAGMGKVPVTNTWDEMRCMIACTSIEPQEKKNKGKRDKWQGKVSPNKTSSTVPKREGMPKCNFSHHAIKWYAYI